jgi:hypothetical protein
MSTEYQIKEINLNDFEKVGDVEITKHDDVTVIEFSSLEEFNNNKDYYQTMNVVNARGGCHSREEEIDAFGEYFCRYEGESTNMDGESVTSDDDLIFRDAHLKEINKFWDDQDTFNRVTNQKNI